MENQKTVRRWSELHELKVVVPSEGKVIGNVTDFLFKEGTNAVYALRVHTRVNGDYTLPVTGIKSIEDDRITIPNAQMLTKAVPGFSQGHSLIARKVVSEKGNEIGTVKDVLLGVEPIVAMRVAGLEVSNGSFKRHSHGFTADAVTRYEDDAIVVDDKLVKGRWA
jgi:uncharacterized protein YrrD